MGNGTGGEIFAKTAKTPPLQSGVARMPLRSKCRPIAAAMRIPCTPHATHLWGPIIFITTRRAASLQTPPPPHMRMRAPPPPYAPTTRIAHINVRPHGLCSDEACRGAPRRDPPSWLPPMGTLRFFQRRGTPRRYVLREFELRD